MTEITLMMSLNAAKAVWTLGTLVFPYLGTRPIDNITAADVLKVLKRQPQNTSRICIRGSTSHDPRRAIAMGVGESLSVGGDQLISGRAS